MADPGRTYLDVTVDSIRPLTAPVSDVDLARLAVAALRDADPLAIPGYDHVADLFRIGDGHPVIDGDEWRRALALLALQRFLP